VLGHKRTFGGFKVQETCLVAAYVVLPAGRSYSALPNPLAGFEEPLRGGGKRGKRERSERKGKER